MSKLSFDINSVIADRVRLSNEQAMELYHDASMQDIGQWAHEKSLRLHPEDYRTYVIDRNINYTNICTARCTFCAFRRDPGDADGYTLDYKTIGEKIKELIDIHGTQILMQGGMNKDLPIEYYEDLLRFIKAQFPSVHIHAFSPPEFIEFEKFFNLDVRDIIRRFKAAGLDSIPGGGGEIFAPRVRRRIGIGKCTGDDWLRVMRVAHEEGLNTSATMLIGHIEFVRERIEHMQAIRDMQDYALALAQERNADSPQAAQDAKQRRHGIMRKHPGVFAKSPLPDEDHQTPTDGGKPLHTGYYTAFIHWPFQPDHTPLGRTKRWDPDTYGPFDESTHEDILRGRVVRLAGADEYLRMLAIARLFFDNIVSLQSSWVTMGPKIGQLALFFGANDMGSVMMEENVVSSAGTTYRLNEREICRLIRDGGWIPAQRDQFYHVLRRQEGADSPDLVPNEHPRVRNVKRIDKEFIGTVPDLQEATDVFVDMQTPSRSR